MKHIEPVLIDEWSGGRGEMFTDAATCDQHSCKYTVNSCTEPCIVGVTGYGGRFIKLINLLKEAHETS